METADLLAFADLCFSAQRSKASEVRSSLSSKKKNDHAAVSLAPILILSAETPYAGLGTAAWTSAGYLQP